MTSDYIIYSLYFNLGYLAFAYVVYIFYCLLLLKTCVTSKMGVKILQKLSILCYEVAAGNIHNI